MQRTKSSKLSTSKKPQSESLTIKQHHTSKRKIINKVDSAGRAERNHHGALKMESVQELSETNNNHSL